MVFRLERVRRMGEVSGHYHSLRVYVSRYQNLWGDNWDGLKVGCPPLTCTGSISISATAMGPCGKREATRNGQPW